MASTFGTSSLDPLNNPSTTLESLTKEAIQLVFETLPLKVNQLHALYTACKAERAPKIATISDALAPCAPVAELTRKLKAEIIDMIDYVGTLNIWVQLMMPTIEDGNNFGVSVQGSIVGALTSGKDSAMGFLSGTTSFHTTRGRLITKWLKYPNSEDFSRALFEMDEKQLFVLQSSARDMRNNCALIVDLLIKNWTFIIKPKGSNVRRTHMLY